MVTGGSCSKFRRLALDQSIIGFMYFVDGFLAFSFRVVYFEKHTHVEIRVHAQFWSYVFAVSVRDLVGRK
jgi:hypothetical protein